MDDRSPMRDPLVDSSQSCRSCGARLGGFVAGEKHPNKVCCKASLAQLGWKRPAVPGR